MKNKGITLISLVITIVILIILASVGIYLSLGNNGIFTRTKQAKELINKQTATEKINLKITTTQMNKYAEEQRMPTLKELSIALGADSEIEYVTESTQIGSKKYEVGENPSSIYTKLNEYPYEFEINSSLQLASINGIKVATGNTNSSYSIEKIHEGTISDTVNFNATQYDEIYIELRNHVSTTNLDAVSTISIKSVILTDRYDSYFATAASSYGVNSYVSMSKTGISNGFFAYNGVNIPSVVMIIWGINY